MTIKSFAALDFVGFKRPTVKEQPPVFDPKTGQQYDLSNPDLPLAVSPAFTVHYWLMPKTQAFVLKYLNERYDFFNHTRFGGKLSKPKLVITSSGSTALNLKNRGVWYSATREIHISIHLFKAPYEGWANNVLIHEMCHQFVTDFLGGESEEKGHGPKWRATMLKAGLSPSRYDSTPNSMYMNDRERRKHGKELTRRDLYLKSYNLLKETREHLKSPKPGDKVVFPNGVGEILTGEIESRSIGNKYWTIKVTPSDKLSVVYEGVHPAVIFKAQ